MSRVWALVMCGVLALMPQVTYAATVTFLTSGTSYSTPADWNNSDNSIECIGAGGTGGTSTNLSGGGGGGGGAYAKITNQTISGSVAYSIAAGGSQANTTFNTTSLVCDAGNNGSGATNGSAGLAANSTGSTKFNGGAGVFGGGGGAGGTTSAGSDGAGDGSGGDGGTVSGGTGGLFDITSGAAGASGGDGTVWQVSPARGAGGGGAKGGPGEVDVSCLINPGPGGGGGLFGGGGGGGGSKPASCSGEVGGTGAQGIIVTTYTPVAVSLQDSIKFYSGKIRIVGGKLRIL